MSAVELRAIEAEDGRYIHGGDLVAYFENLRRASASSPNDFLYGDLLERLTVAVRSMVHGPTADPVEREQSVPPLPNPGFLSVRRGEGEG